MTFTHHELIEGRVRAALGPVWKTGGVGVDGGTSWISPLMADWSSEHDFLTIHWDPEQDPDVAQGRGNVSAIGEVNGRPLYADGPLDDVLARVLRKMPTLLAKRTRRWPWMRA